MDSHDWYCSETGDHEYTLVDAKKKIYRCACGITKNGGR